MNKDHLIFEGNSVYELDDECLKRRRIKERLEENKENEDSSERKKNHGDSKEY